MRIVFMAWRDLANELAGGSEILIDRLATGLTHRGHDVALVCAEPVAPRAYQVVPNGNRHTQYVRAPFAYLRHVRGADLVVDVANGMSFYAPLWRSGPSLCFVNHVHTEQWDQWFPRPIAAVGRELERRAMPRAYRNRLFAAVSPSTAEALQQLGVRESQIRIVCNGVDLPTKTYCKSPEPLFVAVGRLVPHKRFDLLVRAWERVRPYTGGRLVIVGDGPRRTRDAIRAGAGEGVELVGHISDAEKERLYGEAWALVHPATHEGWGLVIMEAAAHGTPALGFRVPGVRDSVVHGESGMLVDTEVEFVSQWVDLTADAALRQRLGEGARRRAAEFSWDVTVDRFEAIAAEAVLLGSRRPVALPGAIPAAGFRHASPPVIDLRARRDTDGRAPSLSIVVPAFNEAGRLPMSLPQLLAETRGTTTEVIIVDDGSFDGTAAVTRRFFEHEHGCHLIVLPKHLGKGAAVRAGVARARGSVIAFMDADLATELADFPRLLGALGSAHVAVGSRTAPGSVVSGLSPARAAMERSFNVLARSVTGLDLRDTQCGFKAFRAPVAKLLFHLSQENGLAFDVEILALAERIGYSLCEVPVRWHAVRGSHIRIPSDTIAMSFSALRIGARTRPPKVMASLRAWSLTGEREPEDVAAGLRDHLDVSAPVVTFDRHVVALLPFVVPAAAHTIAAELRDRLPGVAVKPTMLASSQLFEPAALGLRAALATHA